MSDVKMLERKVNALIDYITASGAQRVFILEELESLKSQVVFSEKSLPEPEKSVKVVTENLLTEIGMPTSMRGYPYIVTAVSLILEEPELKSQIVKGLYPKIAEVHSIASHGSRVERCIRHAIEVTMDRGDLNVLLNFFGNTVSHKSGKPTNSEFICRLTQLVEREMGMC